MKVLANGKDNNGIRTIKINGNDAYLYKHGGGFKVVRADGIEISPDEQGTPLCPHSDHCRNKLKIGYCATCTRNEKDPRAKDYFIEGEMADLPEENENI